MLFRYLAARWRHRGSPAAHFIRSGLGLERRAQHLSAFWQAHLSRSRAAQARWAQTCHGDVLTVLGAGPLLDFNAPALTPRFKRLRLVDGNPLSASSWTRLPLPVEPVITDISNSVAEWSTALKQFRGSWDQALQFIEKLRPAAAYCPSTDAIISLNLLSQLEVGWQETLEPILAQRFGRAFIAKREQAWLNAIRPSSQALAEQHLAALESSRAAFILLICDAEYVDYSGRRYLVQQFQPAPLVWSESGWQAEAGIRFEATAALEGLQLDQQSFTRWMPSYRLEWHESWLWHISPNGTENTDHGTIHRVAAFAFRHGDSSAG